METVHPPPRLILGASVLFWGAMTQHYLIGTALALIVEGAHWIRFRWDFDERACARAWRLTTVAMLIAGTLVFLDGNPYDALPNLLVWMPPLLLPMQFVQSYGMADSLPLNTFSFLAKRRRLRNLRLGLTESVVRVNFGNIYFVIALIACTLGEKSNTLWFLPGIVILTGWRLLASSGSRPASLVIALAFAGGIAIAGQVGMQELYNRLETRGPGGSNFDPNSKSTSIGRDAEIVQSTDIVWRVRTARGSAVPRLLRTATYNSYGFGTWLCKPGTATKFKDLSSKLYQEIPYYLLTPEDDSAAETGAVSPRLPRFDLRGAAAGETPLPLPGDATSLRDFELDGIERNSFGTVRVYPKNSVIEGKILWRGDTNPETAPIPGLDWRTVRRDDEGNPLIHNPERKTLQEVLAKLEIDRQPDLQSKLEALRGWFARDFRYTRHPTIVGNPNSSSYDKPTAIAQFLTTNQTGHCEYFATATVLLLREAGIPARYAIGYAVAEFDADRREFILRGTHLHAWCRVWDEAAGKWIDFDTTPGSWIGEVAQLVPRTQPFSDAVKRFREDFFLWRNRPRNRLAASLVMTAIGLGVAAFVIKRLWRSKRQLAAEAAAGIYAGPVIRTPLNALETQIERRLGPRPSHVPFAAWLERLRPALPGGNPLDEAIRLHQRLRFDPAPLPPAQHDRLATLASELEVLLKST